MQIEPQITVTSDPFVQLPPDHVLSCARTPLCWADIAGLPHISMPPSTSVRQYAEATMLQVGRRFEPRYQVEQLASINAMVAAGLGVSALPALAARRSCNAA